MKRSVILLLTTIILASCGGEKQAENKAARLTKLKKERATLDDKIRKLEAEVMKDEPGKATPVSVINVAPSPFSAYVEVQASVSGDENINATPQAPGIIKTVNVRVGQYVNKGQVLATLDAAAVEQQMKATEAQLTLVKQVYEKQQKLWEKNIGSEIQLLQAKANYESTQKQYEALVAQRNMYKIIAPISGTVDAVNVKEGDATAPGGFGVRVVSFEKLKVVAKLGENYIGKVKQGDHVKLIFSETGDTINTKLGYVARSVDPVSRAFNVEVWLGTNKNISPNMSCKMQIVSYENDSALTVPISAVQNTPDGDMVFVVKGGKAQNVSVETGKNSNGIVEITKGLNAGDKVVTEGQGEISSGDAVQVEQ